MKAPYLSTFIDERDNEASFELVLSTGEYYGLTAADMKQIVKEVSATVSRWRTVAAKTDIPRREMDRMAGAFEHSVADAARGFAK